jgi:hypothetical protein
VVTPESSLSCSSEGTARIVQDLIGFWNGAGIAAGLQTASPIRDVGGIPADMPKGLAPWSSEQASRPGCSRARWRNANPARSKPGTTRSATPARRLTSSRHAGSINKDARRLRAARIRLSSSLVFALSRPAAAAITSDAEPSCAYFGAIGSWPESLASAACRSFSARMNAS